MISTGTTENLKNDCPDGPCLSKGEGIAVKRPDPKLGLADNWFLIDKEALRRIYCDAKKLLPTIADLEAAQEELNTTVAKLKEAKQDIFDKDMMIHSQRRELADFKVTSWYESPWFWGVVGVATGFVVGIIVKVYMDRREAGTVVVTSSSNPLTVSF